jgi:hypothetical protein
MATATVKYNITTNQPTAMGSIDQETVTYSGTVTFSAAADTYAAGGLLPLAGFALKNLGPYADRPPNYWVVESVAGSGWEYEYNVNTGKLQIIAGGGSGTAAPVELTNGTALNVAVPNVFTDVVNFAFTFPRR